MSRITFNADICNGKPTIRGMRITVKTILEYIAAGETTENILKAYPFLEEEDIKECLEFASKITDHSFLSIPVKKAS
jgi:Uncharacterized conserved protein